jgi:hypothetical protein
MTPNEARRTPSDYNVELGDEITARAPTRRRRILSGIAVAICLSVASLIIVLAALRVERENAQNTRDSLQIEQLREGWKTLIGAAAASAERAADPASVAAPVASLTTSADTTTTSAESAPPAVTNTVIMPVPTHPTRASAPHRARPMSTGTNNSQPAHSAGRGLDNPLPIEVPKAVEPDATSVVVPEQGATGVGSEVQSPVPSGSASQPIPGPPDDSVNSAPTPPLPSGNVPDSEPTPTPPSGTAPVTPPTQLVPGGAEPLPAP